MPPNSAEASVVTEPSAPQMVTLVEGSFIPLGRYSGGGVASALSDGSEQRFCARFSTPFTAADLTPS